MKKILFLLSFIVFSVNNTNAQLSLSDADYDALNPLDCAGIDNGGSPNFTDGAGNYTSGMNDTIVLCPDLSQGSKVSISFATNIGYTWNVDGTDTLYIYDGNSPAAPLIGAFNSITDPLSFFVQASWANVSGCLTLVFVTDGSLEGTGWDANVSCGNPFQPFEPHIEAYINGVGPDALNPLDTGYVDVCFGDSILFIATPLFPNSFETNGFGYSQNVDNCVFDWTIGGVGQFTNDSVWFTPPQRQGYYVDLRITDIFPLNARTTCKVRVSQLPSFAGTGPVEDTVCLGQNTNLIGGVTPTDTVGIDIPNGELTAGGTFAGLTFLPDGNGLQSQTSIAFAGFDNNAVVSGPGDMVQVCMDIEHSYLGDLEISLECPNGTIVSLVNANNLAIGMTAGGCGNAIGTFLGNDTNIDGGVPGSPAWTYCFSEVNATLGTMCDENNLNSYWIINDYGFQAMNPAGVYLPDAAWSGFNGCPLNGPWTIIVQDNQGVDDGYIFEWSIEFNSALYPEPEGYQNYVVSDAWLNDPTIISGQNDTLLVVQPNVPGDYDYTYTVIDDYGCYYDTTVTLFVLPQPEIFNDTIACNFGMDVSGTVAYVGGVWSSTDPNISFSDPNVDNPTITSTTSGIYSVSFIDNACNTEVSANIDFPPLPEVMSDTALCSLTLSATGTVAYSTGGTWSEPTGDVSFSPSATTLNPTFTSSGSGVYTITFTDEVCGNADVVEIEFISPPVIFGDTLVCNYGMFVSNTVAYDGGLWTASDTTVHFTDSSALNPGIGVTFPGTYTVTFTDNSCNMSVSANIVFPPYAWTDVADTTVCIGTEITLYANENWTIDNYVWSTGETGPSIVVSEPGVYTVTGSNVCHSTTVSAIFDDKLCVIDAPNIISLSSTSGNNLWFVQQEGIRDFNCVIVNRWGNVIFEINDPAGTWDGRTMKGNLVEEGTYFYTIKAILDNGDPLNKQGFIQVVH
ncbi:MAG: gliding motility-associated C-terminal domain-containing protein [Crocinitomicaceae bacterium]|nr:gliding motility-associated C-terminal domain-containing protein [Flavobacteriales bacterium]NQZ37465.1 gliding motility-associated C-terminal domain-containing protein [Crocinitomicaceae bacterium]